MTWNERGPTKDGHVKRGTSKPRPSSTRTLPVATKNVSRSERSRLAKSGPSRRKAIETPSVGPETAEKAEATTTVATVMVAARR